MKPRFLSTVLTMSSILMAGLTVKCVFDSRRNSCQAACDGNIFRAAFHLANRKEFAFNVMSLKNADGRPKHSWRVAAIISADNSFLNHYDLDESWGSDRNLRAASIAAAQFVCRNSQSHDSSMTNYAAVDDGGYRSIDRLGRDIFLKRSIPDCEASVLLVEIPGSNMLWTDPRDVSLRDIMSLGRGCDPLGIAVVLTNGSVLRLSQEAIVDLIEYDIRRGHGGKMNDRE